MIQALDRALALLAYLAEDPLRPRSLINTVRDAAKRISEAVTAFGTPIGKRDKQGENV